MTSAGVCQNPAVKLMGGNDSFASEFEEIVWENTTSPGSIKRRSHVSTEITGLTENYGDNRAKSTAPTSKLRYPDHSHEGTKEGPRTIKPSACRHSSNVSATKCPIPVWSDPPRVFPRQIPSLAFPRRNTRISAEKNTRAAERGPSGSTVSSANGQRRRAYLSKKVEHVSFL